MDIKDAVTYHQNGRWQEAEQAYQEILRIRPTDHQALSLYGVLKIQLQHPQSAIELIQKAIELKPNFAQAHCNLGVAFEAFSLLDEAMQSFAQAAALKSDYWLAFFNLGNVLFKKKQYNKALINFEKAISIKPDYAQAYMNSGLALVELGLFDQAFESYESALEIKPDYAEALSNKGNLLLQLKSFQDALECYNKAIQITPNYAKAHYNKGNALNSLKLPEQAIQSFDRAITFDPNLVQAFCNRGVSFKELNQFENALHSFHQALLLNQNDADVHFNLGHTYEQIRQFGMALNHFHTVLEINSETELDCHGPQMFIHMRSCNWEYLPPAIDRVIEWVVDKKRPTELLPLLAVTDDLNFLKTAGQLYINKNYPPIENKFSIKNTNTNERIAIGYFSSDFNNHAVSYLISEIFELHDRTLFEVHAFMLGHKKNDDITNRIISAVDYFWDCQSMDDAAIVPFAREKNLQIAIDLNGPTEGCRMNVFAQRIAPNQINYLGFPSSSQASYHDFIIADQYLIPEELAGFYCEKVIYLPCFQANDRTRKASAKVQSRNQLNLPENAFIFCCFNNTYKITPSQFECWMRILNKVENSILWLISDSKNTENNLRAKAEKLGVSIDRLVFAERMPYGDYLESYKCADLFLDTFPFNAGTTASDALWMGLPLITFSGKSFASRMAGSLLQAVNLPEMIAPSMDAYENLAVELATNLKKLLQIKNNLIANRDKCLLFDSLNFTRSLEESFIKLKN